jgi:hypothetical protein
MTAGTGQQIPQLIRTAKTLQRVRRMQQEFMLLWSLDRADEHNRNANARMTVPDLVDDRQWDPSRQSRHGRIDD